MTRKTPQRAPRGRRPAAPAEWTVMVYLAGDNNLSDAGAVDLREMKKVGSGARLHIVAQYDRASATAETTRYYLRAKTTLGADAVQRLGETNMGDPAVLEDFVTWATTTYPARRYLLVLWNHGAGWDDANLYEGDVFGGAAPPVSHKRQPLTTAARRTLRTPAVPLPQVRAAVRRAHRALFRGTVASAVKTRAIAFDDDAKDFLDNIELKRVLTTVTKRLGRPLDIVGMDACLMSMAEVSHQLRQAAAIAVGSQEEEPGDGWPYDRVLRALARRPAMSGRDLASVVVREYLGSYSSREAVTQSAIDLDRMPALTRAVDRLSRALTSALADAAARAAIIAVRAQVQEYSAPYDDYCDLVDLCTLLRERVRLAAVRTAAAETIAAVEAAVLASGSKGAAVAHSHGLSIYFPKRKVSPLYRTLDFTKQSRWDEFLGAYVRSLRR